MGSEPLSIKEMAFRFPKGAHQMNQSNLGSIRRSVKHRLPGEQTLDADSIEAANQLVVTKYLNGMCEAEMMKVRIGLQNCSVDPAMGTGWISASEHHALKAGIRSDLVALNGAPQRPRRTEGVEIDDAPRIGAKPPNLAPAAHRHRKQPKTVSADERGWLQICSDAKQVTLVRLGGGRCKVWLGEHPRTGWELGGSDQFIGDKEAIRTTHCSLAAVVVETLARLSAKLTGRDHPPHQRNRGVVRVTELVIQRVKNCH